MRPAGNCGKCEISCNIISVCLLITSLQTTTTQLLESPNMLDWRKTTLFLHAFSGNKNAISNQEPVKQWVFPLQTIKGLKQTAV